SIRNLSPEEPRGFRGNRSPWQKISLGRDRIRLRNQRRILKDGMNGRFESLVMLRNQLRKRSYDQTTFWTHPSRKASDPSADLRLIKEVKHLVTFLVQTRLTEMSEPPGRLGLQIRRHSGKLHGPIYDTRSGTICFYRQSEFPFP